MKLFAATLAACSLAAGAEAQQRDSTRDRRSLDGESVDWMEQVSEEQYRPPPR